MKTKKIWALLLTLIMVLQMFSASFAVSAASRAGSGLLDAYTTSYGKNYILSAIDYYFTHNRRISDISDSTKVLFMFEGANKHSDPYSYDGPRNQAITVVVEGGEIKLVEDTCSTIPDDPYMKNDEGEYVATVLDGTYELDTINHGEKAWYETWHLSYLTSDITKKRYAAFALNNDGVIGCYRMGGGDKPATQIHLHSREHLIPNSEKPNSIGCLLFGTRSYFYYFVNSFTGSSFENEKQVWPDDKLNKFCGWIVIDRQLAKKELRDSFYGVAIDTITAASEGAMENYKNSSGASDNGGTDSNTDDSGTDSPVTGDPTITLESFTTVPLGSIHDIVGTVTSSSTLSSVIGEILAGSAVKQRCEIKPYTTEVNLKNSAINANLKFAELLAGDYTLKITATNDSGTTSKSIPFTVAAPAKPTITLDPIGTVTYGNPHDIVGTVTSTSSLSSVKGDILSGNTVIQTWEIAPYVTTLNLKNSAINANLKFAELSAGTYTLKITAVNSGGTTTNSISFTVSAPTKKFTIDFKPNANKEQSGSMPNQQVTIGSSDKINKNLYVRSGYTFTGWNTKSDGTGTAYKDQAPAGKITTKNGATVVLYAQWAVSKVFTIDFKPNANKEQSGSMPNQQVKIGSSDKINKNQYVRSGYTFTGWNTKSDGTGTAYKDQAPAGKISTKNGATVVLYAQWAPEKPSIKLNSIGNVSYGNACNITGTVSSNQKLFSVSGVIISGSTSVQWYTQYFTDSDTKTLDLKNSKINMNLKFGKLPRGSYILRITAINWNGKSETASISFKIV